MRITSRRSALLALTLCSSLGFAGLATGSAGAAPRPPSPGSDAGVLAGASAPVAGSEGTLVTVAPGTTDGEAQVAAAVAGATLVDRTGDVLLLDLDAGAKLKADRVDALPFVETVEPNVAIRAFATPNDPLIGEQYALLDNQPGGIRAQSAWNNGTGTDQVVVGVLDSGILLSHPDLVGNLWTNRTGVNGCGYGTHGWNALNGTCNPTDDGGHGTHVAGIVGAVGNNGIGVSGVAQRASLMGLKVLNGQGQGFVADAIGAINFAIAAKAGGVNIRVLQASWGFPGTSAALSDAIGQAEAAGILFVAAAGNGTNNDGIGIDLDQVGNTVSPCEDTHGNVICVGATTNAAALWSGSNFGPGAVDIAAPGVGIWSTVPSFVPNCGGGSYCLFTGTSMATPMISGAAVDILAAEPNLTTAQLKSRILASFDSFGALTGKVATGRLNLCKAIPNCDGLPVVAPTEPANFSASVGDGSATLAWDPPYSNGNNFTVLGYDVEGPNGTTNLPLSASGTTLTGLANGVNATVRVRAIGSPGPGPWSTLTVRPYGGAYEIDALGGIHRLSVNGVLPPNVSGAPVLPPGLTRGIAVLPSGTGGYVLDGFGGLHPFSLGAGNPTPPGAGGAPYWPGWDIARNLAFSPRGGGYIVDGYGGIHAFGIGGAPPATAPVASSLPYWPGWDIARAVTFRLDGKGAYLLDGIGGIHPFRVGTGALPPATTGGGYWPGWDIARGLTLVPGTGGGYMLDGVGGIHRIGAGGSLPPVPSGAPYWPGWDVARGIDA